MDNSRAKIANWEEAEYYINYYKEQILHDARISNVVMETTLSTGYDKDNIPYKELVIRIPFFSKK
jgi:hypothetical protein